MKNNNYNKNNIIKENLFNQQSLFQIQKINKKCNKIIKMRKKVKVLKIHQELIIIKTLKISLIQI